MGQARFRPSHVNATGFPEPERLSSTSALRRVLSHPFVWMRARHRSRGFAASDPASDASSRLPRSRAEELDPLECSPSSSLEGSRGHAPLVDFCNRCDPRARLRFVRASQDHATVARDAACSPEPGAFRYRARAANGCVRDDSVSRAAWPERQPAEVCRARGRCDDDRLALAPPAAIARRGSFAPTRACLGHLVSPVRGPLRWRVEAHRRLMGRLVRTGLAFWSLPRPSPPRLRLSGCPRERAASRAPPRRGTRSAAPEVPSVAGRCFRQGPCRSLHMLSPACGVKQRRLCVPLPLSCLGRG